MQKSNITFTNWLLEPQRDSFIAWERQRQIIHKEHFRITLDPEVAGDIFGEPTTFLSLIASSLNAPNSF